VKYWCIRKHAWHSFIWWCYMLCFIWNFMLDVSVCLWVWMEQRMCIPLWLVCIWRFKCFFIRCTCMLVLSESRRVHVYEYNWEIWCRNVYGINEFICMCFQAGDWNIYIYSQLSSTILRICKMPVFTSLATKPFKRDVLLSIGS